MVFKFIAILTVVAVASASSIRSDLGWNAEPALIKTIEEHDSNPQYTYTYGVEDALTGDSKSLIESRDGDVVHGEYALNDADGYRRTVKYTADAVNGFNAVVDRKPLVEAIPVAVKNVEHVAAPLAVKAIEPVHAPLDFQTIAPLTYTAPTLVKSIPISYSAPAIYKSSPIAYTSPIHFKSVPETYVTRSSFEPTLAYSSGPVIYKSLDLGYSAPAVLRSTPIAFTGPAAYTKSFPSVSQW